MAKILIAYFSASGVTARVAKTLADVAEAELYEIKPKTIYTEEDLDWRNTNSRSSKEMKGDLPYPELADEVAGFQSYEVILVGFPIWWYQAPTIINRFLESYDFSGKKVILFATSGGSGFGKTVEKLKGSVAEGTEILEGKMLNGAPSKEELKAWVKSLNL